MIELKETKDGFVNQVLDVLKDVLPKEWHAEYGERDGIPSVVLSDKKDRMMGVKVEQLKEYYSETESVSAVAEKIVELFGDAFSMVDGLNTFENAKDNIRFALIHETHRHFNENMPYIAMDDLRLVYTVQVYVNNSTGNVFIDNKLMGKWKVTADDLYNAAKNNGDLRTYQMSNAFYGITNNPNGYGAGGLWCNNAYETLSENFDGRSFYVIPSSIHELIAIDEDIVDESTIRNLNISIPDINSDEEMVQKDEILSNKLYYFDMKTKKLMDAKEHYFSSMLS